MTIDNKFKARPTVPSSSSASRSNPQYPTAGQWTVTRLCLYFSCTCGDINFQTNFHIHKISISISIFNFQREESTMAAEVDNIQTGMGFPYWNPVLRRFLPDAPFYASGNIERELLAKQVALDLTEDEKQHIQNMEDEESSEVFCSIVGCGARLKSLDDFEDHYHARHTASCSVCLRVYPTSRLLSLHVSEAHDSFFQAKVAHGFAMYECLVEGCGVKLKTYKSRQQHLVDKHKFPSSFEFFKKARPSKKYRQKVQYKQASHKTEEVSTAMQVEEETLDSIITGVSKISTLDSPPSISFGRRHTHGFAFIPRTVRQERRSEFSASQTKG